MLLFVVQPMVGDMVLPHLGGSSTVWTTCMLFFQVMLLVGYVYAHVVAQKFPFRQQVWIHGFFIVLAVFFLPIGVPEWLLRTSEAPVLYLLLALTIGIGLPMFVVSSSAPLFQHWFGGLSHPHADDPYYLYAASNAGSILALLSYPFLIDRLFGIRTQSAGWTLLFLVLAMFVTACGWYVYTDSDYVDVDDVDEAENNLSAMRIFLWIVITFIPSSLMLGLTHYITTDLASVPLLWVLPLAAYLMSFILVFARLRHPLWLYRIVIPPTILIVFAITFESLLSHVRLIGLHLICFFMIAIYFHGELAKDRPATNLLTQFYIYVALGGALGGVFNALIAPILFDSILEYYLLLAVSIALGGWIFSVRKRFNWMYGLLIVTAGGYFFYETTYVFVDDLDLVYLVMLVTFSLLFLYLIKLKPVLINILLAVLFMTGYSLEHRSQNLLTQERSFYGNYKVLEISDWGRTFMHGTTDHGSQKFKDGKPINEPIGYYHPSGPMGDIVMSFDLNRVGIAGLGIGGLASYAQDNHQFDFFEIDPVVESIARKHFGYLQSCGENCNVSIGDARKLIESQSTDTFDLIIMDAYTSDAIPTHLLTAESVELYLSRVKENGAVIFHVSNRHLDLEGVVGAIVNELGVEAVTKEYYPSVDNPDANSSTFVAVANDSQTLEPLERLPSWRPTLIGSVLWTDSYTNIVAVLQDSQDQASYDLPGSDWDAMEFDSPGLFEGSF